MVFIKWILGKSPRGLGFFFGFFGQVSKIKPQPVGLFRKFEALDFIVRCIIDSQPMKTDFYINNLKIAKPYLIFHCLLFRGILLLSLGSNFIALLIAYVDIEALNY